MLIRRLIFIDQVFVMEGPREWNFIRTAKHRSTQKLLMYLLEFINSYHLLENSRSY